MSKTDRQKKQREKERRRQKTTNSTLLHMIWKIFKYRISNKIIVYSVRLGEPSFKVIEKDQILQHITLIMDGFFTTNDGFMSHTSTIDNGLFFTALEGTEIITLEIIVLCWLLFMSFSLLVSESGLFFCLLLYSCVQHCGSVSSSSQTKTVSLHTCLFVMLLSLILWQKYLSC